MQNKSLFERYRGAPRRTGKFPAYDMLLDRTVDNVAGLARAVRGAEAPAHVDDNIVEISTAPQATVTHLPYQAASILRSSGRWLMLGDAVAVSMCFIIGGLLAWVMRAYVMEQGFQQMFTLGSAKQMLLFLAMGATAMLWFDHRGHYRLRLPYWEMIGHFCIVSVIGLVASGFLQFVMKHDFSRLWLGMSWLLFGVSIYAARTTVRRMLEKRGKWHINTLLVGGGVTADAAQRALRQEKEMGYRIVAEADADKIATLRQPQDWQRLMRQTKTSYIMLALDGEAFDLCQPALRAAGRARLPYAIVPPWMSLPSNGTTPHNFFAHDVTLLHTTNRLTLLLPRIAKRLMDIVLSGLGILALTPLFVVVAWKVRRDGGPAFISNTRVGIHGRNFGCYKFRSMVQDNEAILARALAADPDMAAEWASFQKLKNDPRITPFGRFIRKTSIDELPQLFNVLKGQMSLIGPRPILPGQEHFYGDDFTFYAAVRPGITGVWQVSGRNKLTFPERVALESWYANNWSLWMDIVILMKTVPTLLSRDQAF